MNRLMDPMDKRTRKFPFVYVPAAATDVRVTWAKARIEAQAKQEAQEQTVRPIRKAMP